MTTAPNLTDPLANPRISRYCEMGYIDPLISTPIVVIGCGSIGRRVALELGAMGVQTISLFDPDTVSAENLGTQGWSPAHLGHRKVVVLRELLWSQNPGATLAAYDRKWDATGMAEALLNERPAIFIAVDSMDARQAIWFSLAPHLDKIRFIGDARMSAEVFQIHAIPCQRPVGLDPTLPNPYPTPTYVKAYEDTLYPDDETTREPCTRRSTAYCAMLAAGMLIQSYTLYLRGLPLSAALYHNLVSRTQLTGTKALDLLTRSTPASR